MNLNRRQILGGLAALPFCGLTSKLFAEQVDRSWMGGNPPMFKGHIIFDNSLNGYEMELPPDEHVWIPFYNASKTNKYNDCLQVLAAATIDGNICFIGTSNLPKEYSCRLNDEDNKYCIDYMKTHLGGLIEKDDNGNMINYHIYHTPYPGDCFHTPTKFGCAILDSTKCCLVREV